MTPRRSATGQTPPDKKRRGTRDTGKGRRRAEIAGFVPLTSITQRTLDPASAFDRIRTIYFSTTKHTIHADLAHAIELLKSLPSEKAREKATST